MVHASYDQRHFAAILQSHGAKFRAIGLCEEELHLLYKKFGSMDTNGSGDIGLHNLLMEADLENTQFTQRVFDCMDQDKGGRIEFHEFVLSLWNYCTLDKNALVCFAFTLYDTDGSGSIEILEVEMMLREVYGKSYDKNGNAAAVMRAVKEWKGVPMNAAERAKAETAKAQRVAAGLPAPPSIGITLAEFRDFVRTHAALMWPAFQMQLALKDHIMTAAFWEHCTQTRLAFSNNQAYQPMAQLQSLAAAGPSSVDAPSANQHAPIDEAAETVTEQVAPAPGSLDAAAYGLLSKDWYFTPFKLFGSMLAGLARGAVALVSAEQRRKNAAIALRYSEIQARKTAAVGDASAVQSKPAAAKEDEGLPKRAAAVRRLSVQAGTGRRNSAMIIGASAQVAPVAAPPPLIVQQAAQSNSVARRNSSVSVKLNPSTAEHAAKPTSPGHETSNSSTNGGGLTEGGLVDRPVPTFSRRSSVSIAALEGKESLAAVSESPVLTKKSSFAARSPSESPSLTKKPSFALQSTIAETSPASAAAAPGSPSQRRMSVQTHSAAPGLSKQPSFVLQSTIAESPIAVAASPSSRRMSVRTGSSNVMSKPSPVITSTVHEPEPGARRRSTMIQQQQQQPGSPQSASPVTGTAVRESMLRASGSPTLVSQPSMRRASAAIVPGSPQGGRSAAVH